MTERRFIQSSRPLWRLLAVLSTTTCSNNRSDEDMGLFLTAARRIASAEWLLRVNLCLCDDQQALPASTQLAESPRAFSLFGSLTFKTGLRKGNTVRQSGAISRSRS